MYIGEPGVIIIFTDAQIHNSRVLFVFIALAVLFSACAEKADALKIQDIVTVPSDEIAAIMVSPIIDYQEDWSIDTTKGEWATVDAPADIETIFEAIMDVSIESTEGLTDVTLAGGCPRNVVLLLKDNTQFHIQFIDDQQVIIDGEYYNFCKGQSVYSKIDAVLADYSYADYASS